MTSLVDGGSDREWHKSHLVILNKRCFGVFRTHDPQSFAVGEGARVVEVTEHVVALYPRLEHGAKRCLTLKLR